jgi:hypothetical protein
VVILGLGRRRGGIALRAALWFPEAPAVRRLVAEDCGPEEAARLAPLETPVLGTVHAVYDALGWDTAFQCDGGAPVPVALSHGGLFLTSTVSPHGLNRPVRDGTVLTCWLAVQEDASLADRDRLTAAGWRLGRSTSTPHLAGSGRR